MSELVQIVLILTIGTVVLIPAAMLALWWREWTSYRYTATITTKKDDCHRDKKEATIDLTFRTEDEMTSWLNKNVDNKIKGMVEVHEN